MRAALSLILLGLLAVACANVRAPADEAVPVRVLCDGDRLVALQFVANSAGMITLSIPPDVCEGAPEAPKQPGRSA